MQIGVVYPQTELPPDPRTVRAYVRGVEELGYRHVEIYDHVLRADPALHAGWNGPYDVDTTFHEPLVFYGFLAALTNLELVTAVVVAPQRQTAPLTKQAAEVAHLSVDTIGSTLPGLDGHLDALATAAEALQLESAERPDVTAEGPHIDEARHALPR
jgi:hypothetical protein